MTYSSATHALSVNPATGETLAAYPWASTDDVERAIAQADAGFRQWRRVSVSTGRRSCAISPARCATVQKRWPE